jgi:hypothetical protein
MADDVTSQQKKQRKSKEFPAELSFLTDKDRDKFELVLEIDTNGDDSATTTIYQLGTLSIDNLRKLCKNIGVVNCGSHNKYNCRKAIATYFKYQDKLVATGMTPSSHSSRVTSTVCRAVNVVFSTEFVEEFRTVNDRKNRVDYETKNTNKAFWSRATAAHNTCYSSAKLTGNKHNENNSINNSTTTATKVNGDDTSVSTNLEEEDRGVPDYDSDTTPEDSFNQLIFPQGIFI